VIFRFSPNSCKAYQGGDVERRPTPTAGSQALYSLIAIHFRASASKLSEKSALAAACHSDLRSRSAGLDYFPARAWRRTLAGRVAANHCRITERETTRGSAYIADVEPAEKGRELSA
jgi:hypothetical protein